MKRLIVMAMMVVAGVATAGTLPGMQAWAERANTNEVLRQLAAYGLTNAADREAMSAAWDEDTFVDTTLRARAYGAFSFAFVRDRFTAASMEKIGAAVLAEPVAPAMTIDLVLRLPVPERAAFQAACEAAGAARYAKQPEFGRLYVKYQVLRGVLITAPDVGEDELARYLLAPEIMPLSYAESCKKAIKDRAVVLARLKLRADGKSFVVKNGVNPLAAMVQPVVAALNAPECSGLEAALRDLGSTVTDIDRQPMRDLVTGWRPKVLSGEMSPGDVGQALGKIAVALGPDEYNRFVDVYNNGTGGGK